MSTVSKPAVMSLYRALRREGRKFTDYNFRDYARRRINTGLRENMGLKNVEEINEQYKLGFEQLASLKRQVVVSTLYPEMTSVMDKH